MQFAVAAFFNVGNQPAPLEPVYHCRQLCVEFAKWPRLQEFLDAVIAAIEERGWTCGELAYFVVAPPANASKLGIPQWWWDTQGRFKFDEIE